jgi:hypothetical protein
MTQRNTRLLTDQFIGSDVDHKRAVACLSRSGGRVNCRCLRERPKPQFSARMRFSGGTRVFSGFRVLFLVKESLHNTEKCALIIYG